MRGITNYGNEQNNIIVIERIANGWMVTLPINYPEQPDEFEKQKDLMMSFASEIQAVKEPILREAEKKDKPKEPNTPLIGYVPGKPNVFIYNEWDQLLQFLKDTIW